MATFPETPPQDWPPASVYVAPPTFTDFSTTPLNNRPIALPETVHVVPVFQTGVALTEEPRVAAAPATG